MRETPINVLIVLKIFDYYWCPKLVNSIKFKNTILRLKFFNTQLWYTRYTKMIKSLRHILFDPVLVSCIYQSDTSARVVPHHVLIKSIVFSADQHVFGGNMNQNQIHSWWLEIVIHSLWSGMGKIGRVYIWCENEIISQLRYQDFCRDGAELVYRQWRQSWCRKCMSFCWLWADFPNMNSMRRFLRFFDA